MYRQFRKIVQSFKHEVVRDKVTRYVKRYEYHEPRKGGKQTRTQYEKKKKRKEEEQK